MEVAETRTTDYVRIHVERTVFCTVLCTVIGSGIGRYIYIYSLLQSTATARNNDYEDCTCCRVDYIWIKRNGETAQIRLYFMSVVLCVMCVIL